MYSSDQIVVTNFAAVDKPDLGAEPIASEKGQRLPQNFAPCPGKGAATARRVAAFLSDAFSRICIQTQASTPPMPPTPHETACWMRLARRSLRSVAQPTRDCHYRTESIHVLTRLSELSSFFCENSRILSDSGITPRKFEPN